MTQVALAPAPSTEVLQLLRSVEADSVRRTSPCGDGDMVWRLFGRRGTPPLVLMHGGYGSWWHWIRNVRSLARDRRVYVCDTPGLGESAPPPDRRDMDGIGRIVADGLRHVLEERDAPVDLGACAAEKVIPYMVRREPKERVRCRRRSAPTSRISFFCLRRTCTSGSRRGTWRIT